MSNLANDVENTQNVWVVDPNAVNGDSNIIYPMEDLSIEVDLEVRTAPRFGYSENNYYTLSWRTDGDAKKEARFFQGRRFSGGDNYLSDFYTDINFTNRRSGDIVEGIGIKSINIDYNSWYIPQIVINFVDVRGSALFHPAEYMNETNGESGGSFFKSFFSFPYPMYTLVVKGYLGDRVSYQLHCSDVRHEFDSTTGNFETTAKFIGYTYAFLADIPFNLLKAAPYCNYIGGIDYWNSKNFTVNTLVKDNNGNPVYTPMKTMLEYMKVINDLLETAKLKANDQDLKEWNKLNNKQIFINKIYIAWNELKSFIKNIYIVKYQDINREIVLTDIIPVQHVKGKVAVYEDLKRLVNDYNTQYPEIIIEIPSNIYDLLYNLTTIVQQKYTINYSNLIATLDTISNGITLQSVSIKERTAKKLEEQFVNESGFKPTIDNIMRIIFAHLEVFMDNMYLMRDNVSNRNYSDIQINSTEHDFTDIKIISDDYRFGPFPEFRRDGVDNDGKPVKNVEKWIGALDGLRMKNTYQDLEEVKLVYELLKAVKESQTLESDIIKTKNETKYWYPINPFDISILDNQPHKENPYSVLRYVVNQKFEELSIQVLIRMYYGLLTQSYNESSSVIETFAKSEAKNVFNVFGGDDSIKNRFITNDRIVENIVQIGLNKRFDYIGQIPQIISNNSVMQHVDTTTMLFYDSNDVYNYRYLSGSNDNKQIVSLPLYTTTTKGYENNWFDGNTYKPNIYNKGVNPALQINLSESSVKSVTNTAFTNITFQLLPEHEWLKKLESYKTKIDEPKLVENWKLDIDYPLDFIRDIKFSNTKKKNSKEYDKYNTDSILNITEFNEYYKGLRDSFMVSSVFNENAGPIIIKTDYKNIEYGKKPNYSLNDYVRIIKQTNNYGEYLIPRMRFLNKDEVFEDVFGSLLFYHQNDTDVNLEKGKVMKDDLIREAKALILLSSLQYDTNEINDFFKSENSGYYRIPKYILLFIGGLIKRIKYYKEFKTYGNNKPIDIVYKAHVGIDSTLNGFGTNNRQLSVYLGEIFSRDYGFKTESDQSVNVKCVLKPEIQDILVDYFQKWCSSDDFKSILDSFELKTYDSNNNIKYINETAYKKIFKDFNNKTSITQTELRDTFTENVFKNYFYINPTVEKDGISLIPKPSADGMCKLIGLYTEDVIVLKGTPSLQIDDFKENDVIKKRHNSFSLSRGTVESYLSTFTTELVKLYNDKDSKVANTRVVEPYNDDNICLELYNTLKNINDKWLDGYLNNQYTLNRRNPSEPSFYEKSFNFIDKFYNKIGDKVIINMNRFVDTISYDYSTNLVYDNQESLYQIITSLVTDHNMLFIPTPNYIDWGREGTPDTILSNVFKPMPWGVRGKDIDTPQFTIIYVGEPAKHPNTDESNSHDNFNPDSLDVRRDGTTNVMEGFDDTEGNYKLPCFLVAFSAQNNSIFKNFTLNMNNSVVTDQSIAAVFNISNMGEKNKRVHYGQDLYNIYVSNSYQIEIEMMGCAQIQPLMYFQLVDVPMFRGAYMIYKIVHEITPGNMTTKVTGMRMSNKPIALVKEVYNYDDVFDGFIIEPYAGLAEQNKTISSKSTDSIAVLHDYANSQQGTTVIYGGPKTGMYNDRDYIDYGSKQNEPISKYIMLSDTLKSVYHGNFGGQTPTQDDLMRIGNQMPMKIYNNLYTIAQQYDKVHDYVMEKYNGTVSISTTSMWRHKIQGDNYIKSFHGVGGAVDIQLYDVETGDAIVTTKTMDENNILWQVFLWMREEFKNEHNELFLELSTNKNLSWIHYAWIPGNTYKSDILIL